MTYSVLKLIDVMDSDFHLLLNTLLSRIPVLVVGEDIEIVDDLTESLTKLIPHRHKLVFWRDFTSENEIISVWEEEKHNYEVNRTVACCLSSNLRLALERISTFTSWVISVPLGATSLGLDISSDVLNEIIEKVSNQSGNCGILRIMAPSDFSFSLVNPVQCSLDVEKNIVSKILTRKNQSLERIRRLLRKSLRDLRVSDHITKVVLNLDDESEKLTHDVFEEEINNYVHAARRAVTLLSRIRLARELGTTTSLTERNLFETIGWNGGGVSDLIQFINAEWHEDFSDCVKGGTLSGLGAWVDSMWGT
ncbi:MAG: hypothetical protein BAJATHORv1_20476 [Candidatus Thorarchaeota archaeon]|nr:MAG: hypothetical protein BAJATHORv1_20476 [Candidatus Thorarchaeota archaeon]